MATKRKTMTMIPGKVYDGSAMINEYGEIEFRPYQREPDSSPRFRSLRGADGDAWRIMTNKDSVRIVVTADRLQARKCLQDDLRNGFLTALTELKNYDL